MHKRSYITGHKGHPHFFSNSDLEKLKKSYSYFPGEKEMLAILKNLSDQTKLGIFLLLYEVEEIPVSDIAHILNASQSAVSHALSDLKEIGLVKCSKCGQLRCYSLQKQSGSRKKLLSFLGKHLKHQLGK